MSDVPINYSKLASQQTKNPVIVVQIEGVPDLLVNTTLYMDAKYGDPIEYGDAGLVYGGLAPYIVTNEDGSTSTFRPYMDLDGSSLTLGQKLEPEQGKASVSTLNLAFIDFQGYMTRLVTPGQIVPEILGCEVRVFIGFTQISYPGDFLEVFRGYISSIDDGPGSVVLGLSDPNIKRRQTVFYCAQGVNTQSVGASTVVSGSGPTSFTVQTGDGVNFTVGETVFVAQADWQTASSPHQNVGVVLSIVGDVITTTTTLGFTPAATYVVWSTKIIVGDNTGFFAQITGPDGAFYPGGAGNPVTRCYAQIDDEWIEVQPDQNDPTILFVLLRGARGTTPASHAVDTTIAAALQLGCGILTDDVILLFAQVPYHGLSSSYVLPLAPNPINALDMALQVMLSGWGGPWITGEPLGSIGLNPDPDPSIDYTNFLVLPAGVDAVRDYGLVALDWVTVDGSVHSGNNDVSVQIIRFADNPVTGDTNNLIFVALFDQWLKDTSTAITVSFRSQYDVLPVEAGLSLTPKDIDIAQHIYLKNTFLGAPGNDLVFFIIAQEDSGKNWLESQVYFVVGAYSLTRRGLLSCGYHSPPIGSQSLTVLDETNVLEPASIRVTRALNNRAFFNEIDITYGYDDTGTSNASLVITDSDSLAEPSQGGIGIVSALPVDAQGVYDGYNIDLLEKRAFFLLTRYKRGAVQFNVKVNWRAGSTIEVGDIVTFDDKGTLQIANFTTGGRAIDNQLFEVINRSFDFRNGNITLGLVGGVGATLQDRFATVSPSSLTTAGCTANSILIQDSFGALYPGNESKKWANYIGLPLLVHSPDFTTAYTPTLLSIDLVNNYQLNVSTMGGTPPAGYIVDIASYPSGTDPTVNQFYKLMHCFLTPAVNVVTAADSTHFQVGAGDTPKFFIGAPIRVHSSDFSIDSDNATTDLTVLGIVGNVIQTSAPMGFTPTSGMTVDLIGFSDFDLTSNTGQPYRLL